MGKKKKSVSQVVIAQSDTSDDLKPETDAKLEETKLEENEISITAPPAEETCQIQMAEKEQLNEDTPILSNTEDIGEPKPENDKNEQEEDDSKTVETTTSENSVELKEIQIKPEDEPLKKTKTNCSKGWCMIL